MAFQLDSNVYSKQRSLSDYMAVNEARDLQRAQAEQAMAASQQGMKASQMNIEAAKQKQEMEKVGMGLAGATEADYPARREALIKEGMPPQFLPEQYNPTLIDAIMTKTGYKSKPSLAEQLMAPLAAMTGARPLSEMVTTTPEPMQKAAPITPQGSIATKSVGNIDQYAVDSGVMPPANNASLDDIVSQARAMEAGQTPTPAPNQQMMPPTLPAQIPDTNLSTPVPAYQPKTLGAAYEADKAAAKASAEAMAPMSAKQRAEIAIKQAPIEEAKRLKIKGQQDFDKILKAMDDTYTELENLGATTSTAKTGMENVATYAGTLSDPAQYIGKVTGSPEYAAIKKLEGFKLRVKEAIMKASGMSAKSMDSNNELQTFLNSLGDPKAPIETNRDILKTMWDLYGTPEAAAARNSQLTQSNATTSGSSAGNAPMQIKSADDYNALPKGTVYIDPNGKQRTKQ